MGWCSGTEIFDAVVSDMMKEIEKDINNEKILFPILVSLIKGLWREDWDCETDSDYLYHPLVMRAMIAADIRMKRFYQDNPKEDWES